RDAMPEHGTLAISVGVTSIDEATARAKPGLLPRDYVLITVSDTGCGMTQEVQSHLFEPFFTTKGVGKGTGLGLSTVYAIVEQGGGQISISSSLGKGTTFSVYFPAVEEAATLKSVVSKVPVLPRRDTI